MIQWIKTYEICFRPSGVGK